MAEGHTLVIPKKQVEFLWDLEDGDYTALMQTVKKLGRHLREMLGVPYVGIKVIGVDVPHTHVHLVPFTSSAEYANTADLSVEPDHAHLAEIAQKLAL
jgi:histidine triad (HIT) family protein